jgi:DNA-directed RNA polymerase subunit RPC12/RpoP
MNCENEIAWDRKLDTPLDRKEWTILAEDEWDASAVKAGFYGKCWNCGRYFNLWMAPDKEWVKSGCQGMICKECFNRALVKEAK